uniref:UDP-glucuronosyltransferase n=1 Tax=Cacopsylla melanoneura TaxID=428564 RepID=A0A8D8LN18_9HEMI
MTSTQLTCLLVILLAHTGLSFNILVTNLIPFQSHLMTTTVIANSLAERGHNVTLITLKAARPHPKLNVIINEDVFRLPPNFPNIVGNFSAFEFGKFMMDRAADTSEELLATPLFKKLINVGTPEFQDNDGIRVYNMKYDVIIAENHFMQEIYAAALSEKFNCPLISYQPILTPPHAAHLLGNYYNPAFMADYKLRYIGQMNFWQRLENSVLTAYEILYQNFIYLPRIDAIMRQHFAKVGAIKWPYIKDILRARNSLTLVDTHHIVTDPKPNNPNVIEMGGIHIKPAGALPKDIEDFMNASTHGVIFFAMGTFVDGQNLTPKKKANLLKLFSGLKQRIIWKIDPANFHENLSPNVKIGKWFPQNDILAHPKCVLFITHGGIHSVLESLYHGVPMVGIPVFADQEQNLVTLQVKGMAEMVPFDFEFDDLKRKVDKVLAEQSYKHTADRYSAIYRTELPHIVRAVMFYIEYVVRHNGAPHLRTASVKLNWYQYFSLDVFLVLLLGLGGSAYLVYKMLWFLVRIVGGKGNKQKTE